MKNGMMSFAAVIAALFCAAGEPAQAIADEWYTEGDFSPKQRIRVTILNSLDIDRKDCPVVITREQFPVKRLHEMWVTVVDPALPTKAAPSKEEAAFAGGHGIREETNDHRQLLPPHHSLVGIKTCRVEAVVPDERRHARQAQARAHVRADVPA